jgi:hypothetical protein
MKQINEAFSQEESSKIYDNFLAIVNDKKRRDRLVSKHGKNAEAVAYGTAVNQVKKQAANKIAEPTTEEPMEDNKLKEMVKAALSKPLNEKKKSFPDLTGDGKITKADVLKARGVDLDEGYDEFEMEDEFEAYFSMVGRNDVPYPVVLGKKNVYFMLESEHNYVPRDKFPAIQTKEQWENAYIYYFGSIDPETGEDIPYDIVLKKKLSMEKYSKKMKGFHMIQDR